MKIFMQNVLTKVDSFIIIKTGIVPIIDLKGGSSPMMKRSRQRDAVRENLMKRYDHPTAEAVYMDIKEEFPNVSLGTVYRNLSLLADLGEIQKISTGAGPDRFDGNPSPHCHFQCRKCYNVLDIPFGYEVDLNAQASKNFPGIIEGNRIQFYGLCPDCM